MADSSISSVQYRRGGRVAGGRGRAAFSNRGRGGRRDATAGVKPGVVGSGNWARGRGAMRGGRGSWAQGGRRPGLEDQRSGKTKQKWRPSPQHKVFAGSAEEGQGFALWRKQKVQLEYKKLLRKQNKANVSKEVLYTDHYPEHLKHLYLAEEEKLRNEEEKRRKPKDQPSQTQEEETEVVLQPHTNPSEDQSCERLQQCTNSSEKQPFERPRKKLKKKTSNQKAKEEYERVQLERAKKREEAENNRKKREEAQKLYKQKKMEAYKILSTKTKKGQPNFNVQMEYLLKKIQSKS
ncbi:thyroid transcription factor 1-associated protein 26 [Mixophyes fleayi]|uniref:thyroid transcription factor 1-associated protein 26 n=1 Tax=Mixophyes fleayi TaxID=3061075 RepID=UPI003F4DD6B6